MKIKEVRLEHIAAGTNWKVVQEGEFDFDLPLEEWDIEQADEFDMEDTVAYSGVYVVGNIAIPLILVKEVQDMDYGGDYCQYVDGKWSQVGLVPNPDAPDGDEYIANPLPQDPSFDTDWDHRGWHRENFGKSISKIKWGQVREGDELY